MAECKARPRNCFQVYKPSFNPAAPGSGIFKFYIAQLGQQSQRRKTLPARTLVMRMLGRGRRFFPARRATPTSIKHAA